MGPAKPENVPGRILSLDGLRAISILLVLYGHARGTYDFPDTKRLHQILRLGDVAHFGVRVFFVISGFLITSLLLSEMKKTGTVSLGSFYIKRAFRIFPPYYLYIGVALVFSRLGFFRLPWRDAILAFTYTVNYSPERVWYVGHAWSLSIEEQFYLIWPAVFRWAGAKRGVTIALVVVALTPLLRIGWALAFPSRPERAMIAEAFPTVADSIATGCLLALLRPRLHRSELYLSLLRSRYVGALALVVSYFTLWLDDHHAWISWAAGETALSVSIAIIIDRCVRYPFGPVGRFLNWRPLAYIGTISYSLYLWQQPFLVPVPSTDHRPEWWIRFPYNLLLSFAAALVSFYLIEKPSLRLRGLVMGETKPAPLPGPASGER